MEPVIIYTDGACKGNPGVGGWGVYLTWKEHSKEICGGKKRTTNNQMELTAVIEALKAIKRKAYLVIHTDSRYVHNGITKWIHTWRKNGWRTSTHKPVKNIELWQELSRLVDLYDIEWHWVKGHANIEGNEKADKLANKGCLKAV